MVPILPALALSLVTPRLAKPPFANNFITFSAQPEFVELDPACGFRQAHFALGYQAQGEARGYD